MSDVAALDWFRYSNAWIKYLYDFVSCHVITKTIHLNVFCMICPSIPCDSLFFLWGPMWWDPCGPMGTWAHGTHRRELIGFPPAPPSSFLPATHSKSQTQHNRNHRKGGWARKLEEPDLPGGCTKEASFTNKQAANQDHYLVPWPESQIAPRLASL